MAYKRWMSVFDTHGDMIDPNTRRVILKFKEIWKPEIRVHGGDAYDNRSLRSKASEEERRESLLLDHAEGDAFLQEYEPTEFLEGNHDFRIRFLAELNNGVKSDFARVVDKEFHNMLKRFRCHWYPYDKRHGVCKLGKLKVIHGYSCGQNAAYRAALTYGNVLMGHVHAIQHVSIPSLENRIGWTCGCACKLDMDYLSANLQSLTHRHGFAYGIIKDNGEFEVFQAQEVNGRWLLAKEFIEL